jgi:hypothetical protein
MGNAEEQPKRFMRFGVESDTCWCHFFIDITQNITLHGQTKAIKPQGLGDRYVYGAVSPIDGESFFLVMPYCNTDCMNVFLRELSAAIQRHGYCI